MKHNIRFVSSYPIPGREINCGIARFTQKYTSALGNLDDEVNSIRVSAINDGGVGYSSIVDGVIEKKDGVSWEQEARRIISVASERKNPAKVILEHEYGLDGEHDKTDYFVSLARAIKSKSIPTIAQLHTVLRRPSEHQKRVMKDLGEICDGLIVTTYSAIDILNSEPYGLNREKIKHIDHGIDSRNITEAERGKIKAKYGLENKFVLSTIGFKSPGKGIEYGIEAYGKLAGMVPREKSKDLLYIVGGKFHPNFVAKNNGEDCKNYEEKIFGKLREFDLKSVTIDNIERVRDIDGDVNLVFLEKILTEEELSDLDTLKDIEILPYREPQQISSGRLADTIGKGRIAIAPKFEYALELIHPNGVCGEGLVFNPVEGRGILVDFEYSDFEPPKPSTDQMAEGLERLIFETNLESKEKMEANAEKRGNEMRWDCVIGNFIEYLGSFNR